MSGEELLRYFDVRPTDKFIYNSALSIYDIIMHLILTEFKLETLHIF